MSPSHGLGTARRVVYCSAASPQFFSVMGIHPALGRLFTPQEYASLHNHTVLISWKFWQKQLGGDPHVIGPSIRIEDVSSIIVGVLPSMPDLYPDTEIWEKLTTEPSWEFMNWRANKFLEVIGRLKPGVSRSVAEQQLTSILRRSEGEPKDDGRCNGASCRVHEYGGASAISRREALARTGSPIRPRSQPGKNSSAAPG